MFRVQNYSILSIQMVYYTHFDITFLQRISLCKDVIVVCFHFATKSHIYSNKLILPLKNNIKTPPFLFISRQNVVILQQKQYKKQTRTIKESKYGTDNQVHQDARRR